VLLSVREVADFTKKYVTSDTGIRKSSQIGGDQSLIANLSAVIGIFRHLGPPFRRYISDASRNYVSVILAETFARYWS